MTVRRKYLAVIGVFAVLVGVLVMRAAVEGTRALANGEEQLAQGHVETGIKWLRQAARWYLPGAPYVADAHHRLQEIGHKAEATGDVATALAAWRASRGAILATRSFYTPHADYLEEANQAISRLMARSEVAEVAPGATAGARVEWHYELLSRDESPSAAWFALAFLGFVLWIGGGFYFALKAVTKEGRLQRRHAAHAGIMVTVGLVVWLTGLYMA